MFGRLFNRLVRFHPPDRIRITEHPWDGVGHELVEPPVQAWFVDDAGLRVAPLEDSSEVELRGMYCSVFWTGFGLSPDGCRMLWEEVSGPLAGSGLECWLSADGQLPPIERCDMVWIS
jgi:hypothetical protein